MALIAGTCQNCGSKIEFDESMKKGFCISCGTQFVKEDIVHQTTQNIKIENAVIQGGPNEENLVLRMNQLMADGGNKKALEYADRVLDINPDNEFARSISQLRNQKRQERLQEFLKKTGPQTQWTINFLNKILPTCPFCRITSTWLNVGGDYMCPNCMAELGYTFTLIGSKVKSIEIKNLGVVKTDFKLGECDPESLGIAPENIKSKKK